MKAKKGSAKIEILEKLLIIDLMSSTVLLFSIKGNRSLWTELNIVLKKP